MSETKTEKDNYQEYKIGEQKAESENGQNTASVKAKEDPDYNLDYGYDYEYVDSET